MIANPPNILLITSDQQRADCFGFENPLLKTPHLDRLARDGSRFSACNDTQPGVPAVTCLNSHRSAATYPRRVGQWH
jgi:arylsulfatase A-like enzyme